MKIALAQINTTIGAFSSNKEKVLNYISEAKKAKVDLIVFPELTITGYPPRDLLEKKAFVRENLECLNEIASDVKDIDVVIGYVSFNESNLGHGLFNMACLISNGKIVFTQAKTLLPEYDVFDESRYFETATSHDVFNVLKKKIALSLCEDLWVDHDFSGRKRYQKDPIKIFTAKGIDIIINLAASPYTLGKQKVREQLVSDISKKYSVPVVYCNMVGGNDELVFDGQSFVTNSKGEIVAKAKMFKEDLIVIDMNDLSKISKVDKIIREEEILDALKLGVHDYICKCSFSKAVIGVSGGIDSALVLAIACMAIGPDNVTGIIMPSEFTSKTSIDDAIKLCENFGVEYKNISIKELYDSYCHNIEFISDKKEVDIVKENIQARIRGNILMAYSNHTGAIVLSTGNKSELSVGYCTLYGDMAGGLSVISDIPKTLVYKLCYFINKNKEFIPESILQKPPTAELKPNQTDQDVLPDYEILDEILRLYVEEDESAENIVNKGFDKKVVKDILRKVNLNEYKRRQGAPGLKITSKAFGVGRRFPIAWKG